MEMKVSFQAAAAVGTPVLCVFAVDVAKQGLDAMPVVLTTTDDVAKAAAKVLATGEFKAGAGETLMLHGPSGLKAERLLLVGLGKAGKLSLEEIRRGGGTAVRACKTRGLREVAMLFPEDKALADEHLPELPCVEMAEALATGVMVGEPDWDTYRSDRKDNSVRSVTVVAEHTDRRAQGEIEQGWREGRILGEAQNFARVLVNEPGNVLTPSVLGERTAAMCEAKGIRCEVYSTEKMKELKMGAFLAVAQGSTQAPALIVMTYEPEGGSPEGAPVVGLVGKGITFDSGGISIKPADGMEKMKYDMAGAAAMIGAMHAIAELKPRVKVVAVVCSAENMPDGGAFKPGDVVTAMSGKTIEIINTDAEGRLVLADGLHFAKTLGCTHLIDAATLTGACVVALGRLNAGLFGNDERSMGTFKRALGKTGERFWQLPCTDDYAELIKSAIADIMNTGANRFGGATTAAMFLKEFAGETPWLHLDIAGMAWNEESKPWIPKGPSGVAVRSIVRWVQGYSA